MSQLQFKMVYDSYNRGPMGIDGVVEIDIQDAGRMTERGELEALRAELDRCVKIVGFMSRFLTDEQQQALVAMLGGFKEVNEQGS